MEKAIFAQRLDHDNHTEVAAAVVDTALVVPEIAYWLHGLVAELPISAEVAGLAVSAAEVVGHYREPTRDFSVY